MKRRLVAGLAAALSLSCTGDVVDRSDVATSCLPASPVWGNECATSGQYYWNGFLCSQAQECSCQGLLCSQGYDTEAACENAHQQCVGRYVSCGGLGSSTMDCGTTQFCAYQGALCGTTDAGSLCLPRPTSCSSAADPVCACDGRTYVNACEAARAGFGYGYKGACSA